MTNLTLNLIEFDSECWIGSKIHLLDGTYNIAVMGQRHTYIRTTTCQCQFVVNKSSSEVKFCEKKIKEIPLDNSLLEVIEWDRERGIGIL